MGIGKWEPWRNMDEFRQQMERLFDETRYLQNAAGYPGFVWSPMADMLETAQALIVQMELPGVSPDQMVVEVMDGDLVVRGERPCNREEPEPSYLLMERTYGTFARRFPLPPGIESQDITACLREGLLTITLPKASQSVSVPFTLVVG